MNSERNKSLENKGAEFQYKPSQKSEIDLKDIFRTIWLNKFFILSISLVSFIVILSAGLVIRDTEEQVQTMVELQWEGITKGEYPDGSTFSYSNMFESYVMSEAIEKSSLELETNALRNNLEVTPIVPNDITQRMQQALENGEEMTYHAVNYKISIIHNELGINSQESVTLLNNLMDAFREDFLSTYTQRDIVLDYTDADYEDYDYVDVHSILSRQANRIEQTVNNQLPEANDYVSTELGYGFNELLSRTELIRDIELDYIDARISNYLLTKDADLRVTTYNHRIEQNDRRLETLNDVTSDIQDSINNYSGGEIVIIVPGTDIPEEYASEPYLSTLYERLTNAQEEVAELESENAYYEMQISRYEGEDPDYDITEEKYQEEIQKVEASIDTANTRLKSVVDDTETMLEEYNLFRTRNEIRVLMAPDDVTVHSIDTLLLLGISIIVGGTAGLGSLFFKEMFKGN